MQIPQLHRLRQTNYRGHANAKQIIIYRLKICEHFLHLIHDIMHICLCELLNSVMGHSRRKVETVLGELWIVEFSADLLHVVFVTSEEEDSFEMC